MNELEYEKNGNDWGYIEMSNEILVENTWFLSETQDWCQRRRLYSVLETAGDCVLSFLNLTNPEVSGVYVSNYRGQCAYTLDGACQLCSSPLTLSESRICADYWSSMFDAKSRAKLASAGPLNR